MAKKQVRVVNMFKGRKMFSKSIDCVENNRWKNSPNRIITLSLFSYGMLTNYIFRIFYQKQAALVSCDFVRKISEKNA